MLKPRILVTGAIGKIAKAIGQVVPMPIELISGVRYCIDDHKCGAFELGAPAADVLDVIGQPVEEFETIARRYASLPPNLRTVGNWLRQFAQFVIAPLSPGVDLERHDRELRRPFPPKPSLQLSPRSGCVSIPWLTQSAAL